MDAEAGSVREVRGDLFASGAEALVNPINISGAMGAGLALAFRRRVPDMYADYRERVAAGSLQMGEPYLWRPQDAPRAAGVVCFPTKRHWRDRSRWSDIEQGLDRLASLVPEWGVASLAVPALGCGLGGLDWEETRPLLMAGLAAVPARVLLYAPG